MSYFGVLLLYSLKLPEKKRSILKAYSVQQFVQYMFYKYLAGMLQMILKHLVSLDESPSINICDYLNLEP